MNASFVVSVILLFASVRLVFPSDSNIELQGIQIGALRRDVEKSLVDVKSLGLRVVAGSFSSGQCETYLLPGDWRLTVWYDFSGSVPGESTISPDNRVLNVILSPPKKLK